MNRWTLIALTASLGLAACAEQEAASAPQAETPAAQAAAPVAQAPAAAQAANVGTVMHAENAAGYTYAQVDLGNGRAVWIAGGQIAVKAGDQVQWGDYAVMRNFHARSLNRTFEEILFVNAWGPAGGAMAQVAPHGSQPGEHPPLTQNLMTEPGPGAESGQVQSVTTAGGYSYLEVAKGDASVWIAVPETSVKAGDTVSWTGGMTMRNFEAKSLGRTFPEIVFADAVSVAK